MDAKARATPARTYEDFEPASELVHEEEVDTLLIDIPEFIKEQVRVLLDNSGNMRISGERPLEGNRWSRFRKDVRVPDKCEFNKIHAKLDDGTLHITMPKLITRTGGRDQTKKAEEKLPPIEKRGKGRDDDEAAGQKAPLSTTNTIKERIKKMGAENRETTKFKVKEPAAYDARLQKPASTGVDEKLMRGKREEDARTKDNAVASVVDKQKEVQKSSKSKEKFDSTAVKQTIKEGSNGTRSKDGLDAVVDHKRTEEFVDRVKEKLPRDDHENTRRDGLAEDEKMDKQEKMRKPLDHTRKTADNGSTGDGDVTPGGVVMKNLKPGVSGLVSGLDQPKRLVLNVVVASIVVVALGVYIAYKFKSQDKE